MKEVHDHSLYSLYARAHPCSERLPTRARRAAGSAIKHPHGPGPRAADLAGLARLRDEVAPLEGDPALGYLAHYWAGFASWRIAINGASHQMSAEDLKANLQRAKVDFEASIQQKDDFADAHAAAFLRVPDGRLASGDVRHQRPRRFVGAIQVAPARLQP